MSISSEVCLLTHKQYFEELSLQTEGVLVAKKDFNQPKHGEIDTKNLFVYFSHANQRLHLG